ncbi:MAG: WGR domain-containing protein [Myxococcaceae bacterium]|nr:WGR domain-containing protein [Myxococcaceae bacterium]
MRRYEFVEGSSKKFWEIELEGESFTTRWGRIGTDGQEKTQDFDSAAEARTAHDKLVAEKEKKGYRLVSSDEGGEARPLTAKVPSNPTLLAAVVERPDDGQAWQVFADWLLEQGESWGEVIGAAARGKPDSARQSKVAAELLGDAEAELEWKHGVIDRFVYAPMDFDPELPMEAVVERVLKHPARHFVHEVSFGLPPCDDGDIEWHMEGLAKALEKAGPLPRLEVIDFSEPSEHMDQESWRRVGDVRGLWKAAPNLKTLKLRGSSGSDDGTPIKLAPIDAPNLETLVIFSGGLDEAAPLEIGKAQWPKLKRLELYFGDENYGCTSTVESLAGILAGKGLPALSYLGLENSMFEADLVEALAKAPLVKRLEVLDLSKGILWRAGAEALVKHAGDFEHLKRLVLDDNYLEEAHRTAISAVLKNVDFGEQKEPDDFDGDEPYRYTTIAE